MIGISGGIAAYKIPELIRLFIKAGAEVKVVATKNALEFVTRLTLETVSKNTIYVDPYEEVNTYSTEHIALNEWADLFLIAPATANVLGKFAGGIADDSLSTTFLAFNKPVFIAPAMNTKMYEHPSVQKNLQFLREIGIHFLEPAVGELACGDFGKGRMEDVSVIFKKLSDFIHGQLPWSDKKILITAGPTFEKIDPVRFIGNYSSGKMGFSLAEACANRGATVLLIAGPVSLTTQNPRIERVDVESAAEMFEVTTSRFSEMDAAILCAAVADFTPAETAVTKTKRGEEDLILQLMPTKDIAAALGNAKKDNQILVGFALETDQEVQNAKSKLERKNLDFIVLNSLKDAGAGFKLDTNKITILNKDGYDFEFPLKSKKEVAEDILDVLANYIGIN